MNDSVPLHHTLSLSMEPAFYKFTFLAEAAPRLARLDARAERYFVGNAATVLVKLRQFGEILAVDMAAQHGLLPSTSVSFNDVLRALRAANNLPRQVADLLFYFKRLGNVAVHEEPSIKRRSVSPLWTWRSLLLLYSGLAPSDFHEPLPLATS